jgi:hypothetical protein
MMNKKSLMRISALVSSASAFPSILFFQILICAFLGGVLFGSNPYAEHLSRGISSMEMVQITLARSNVILALVIVAFGLSVANFVAGMAKWRKKIARSKLSIDNPPNHSTEPTATAGTSVAEHPPRQP